MQVNLNFVFALDSALRKKNFPGGVTLPARRAFSLVELLAAVGIIAILFALLVPLVGMIKERVNSSGCVVNLRRIDTGLQTYLSENNFVYHSHYWQWPATPTSTMEGNSWFSAAPDGRLTGSYIVPSNPGLRNIGNPLDCRTGKKKAGNYHIDYAYNLSLAGVSKVALGSPRIIVTAIEGGDDGRVTSGASNPALPQFLPGGTAYNAADVVVPVHGGKCNVLFADGHLEALEPAFLQPKNFNPFLTGN